MDGFPRLAGDEEKQSEWEKNQGGNSHGVLLAKLKGMHGEVAAGGGVAKVATGG
jgi:hypothetical protein